MTFQWGSNPEYTIETWYDFTSWKLPFGVSWRWFTGVINASSFSIEFMFLCFGIQLEIWQWRKSE
jgi:hypothetical protein